MKPAQFEQPSRRADRSNRQTVITYKALSSNSRYTPDGFSRATFPDNVIFIQQFQIFTEKIRQTAPRRKSSIAKPQTLNPICQILHRPTPVEHVGEAHKLYRRLTSTNRVAV
ncbi:hypothetical protein GFL54_14410 [Rhizobium laguerreae]|nr:hypothetical protein [Rhizobium laguerreae]NKM85464.1 hypothetical protein [Rhizobium laguerreae]OOO48016.1 hypothetical protein BS630_17360 [Rhizobium laguerreae]